MRDRLAVSLRLKRMSAWLQIQRGGVIILTASLVQDGDVVGLDSFNIRGRDTNTDANESKRSKKDLKAA